MKQIKFIFSLLFLPLILLKDVVTGQNSAGRKVLLFIFSLITFGSIWWSAYAQLKEEVSLNLFRSGITDKITMVKVSGTSMLPTIKDGSQVSLSSPIKYGLARGDIVSFNNQETGGLFYIKRIIGLPGEQIVIKNGSYYINGKALEEDYTFNHLPTYGNTFLADCDLQTVPANSYFVSGDNRTVSQDSRVIGFVAKNDIEGVIKTNTAGKFVPELQSASNSAVPISAQTFQTKLNQLRSGQKLSPLSANQVLNDLAKKRAEQIRDNFSSWKNNAVPVDKLLGDNGYRFNSVHEFVTFGYLNEQNILDQIMESTSEKNQFLSSNITEMGMGVTTRTNGECTYPIISIIVSWPAVPTYDQAVLDQWAKEIGINKQSLANLQTWVGVAGIDQAKLKTLISTLAQMQQTATRIYSKEKNQQWLSPQDYQDIQEYENQVKQSDQLSDEIFGKNTNVKGTSTQQPKPRF